MCLLRADCGGSALCRYRSATGLTPSWPAVHGGASAAPRALCRIRLAAAITAPLALCCGHHCAFGLAPMPRALSTCLNTSVPQ
eukprot:3382337-Prymnesium_polylepis.3